MLSRVLSSTVLGIDGLIVHVEVDLSPGLPRFSTVGLPDAAVRESKDRVVAAVKNSGYDFPPRKVTVNLSPADIKKEGTTFDLPIAVGVLAAQDEVPTAVLSKYGIVGELALDGHVRPIRGILPIVMAARQSGWDGVIFPAANWEEACLVEGIELIPVSTLQEAARFLKGQWRPETIAPKRPAFSTNGHSGPDFSEVKGQAMAKRALEIAATGAHNVLMIGPPGSGKTLLARCMAGILPPLEFEESLEVTKIHSVAGLLDRAHPFLSGRPFRSPHHTVSNVALAGGGTHPRPGEVSLAHRGVLFLDEFPEFDRHVLEVLRQPLEDGAVSISRAASSITFPARFMLIAAMNPCPCGYQGHPERECVCSPFQVQKYRSKLSGPLLDRIDLQVEVPALRLAELAEDLPAAESSSSVRARVDAARERQRSRFKGTGIFSNAQMGPRDVKQHCRIDDGSRELLKKAVVRLGLSARSFDRILKVSRTLADLEGSEAIRHTHVAEAVGYRSFDRAPVLGV